MNIACRATLSRHFESFSSFHDSCSFSVHKSVEWKGRRWRRKTSPEWLRKHIRVGEWKFHSYYAAPNPKKISRISTSADTCTRSVASEQTSRGRRKKRRRKSFSSSDWPGVPIWSFSPGSACHHRFISAYVSKLPKKYSANHVGRKVQLIALLNCQIIIIESASPSCFSDSKAAWARCQTGSSPPGLHVFSRAHIIKHHQLAWRILFGLVMCILQPPLTMKTLFASE